MHFLVVGAGQLGSRHGQALARVPSASSITFVDPDKEALVEAKRRVREVSSALEVVAVQKLTEPVHDPFLAVVATSSLPRPEALESVFEFCSPKHTLLEKLVATSIDRLNQLEALCEAFPTQTYVNCPMPFFDHYLELQCSLETMHNKIPRIEYRVSSNSLGLVTNSIHYLDHFYRVTNKRSIQKVEFDQESHLVESKRRGYSEVVGVMRAETVYGDNLVVEFRTNKNSPELRVEIEVGSTLHVFDEARNSWELYDESSSVWRKPITTPKQSSLTNLSIERLLRGEKPNWSPFSESVELHKHLLAALTMHFPNQVFT